MVKKWIDPLDALIWVFVVAFFLISSYLNNGETRLALLGAGGVIILMTVIGVAIEIIIEGLRNIRGIGTLMGFITNGPEGVVLLVGILTGDPLFGASTPLGSNVINPLMFFLAAVVSGMVLVTLRSNTTYAILCILSTVSLALFFYLLSDNYYLLWVIVTFFVTIIFFFLRPQEGFREKSDSEASSLFTVVAIVLLFTAGYFLDPVVDFAGEASKASKGLIGFLVLAALSSWPELKSVLVLFKKGRVKAAGLNIFVSNIVNLWLAAIGVLFYLFL